MEKLQVELGSVVSGLDVSLELPTIIQTSGLPQDDALAFVKDCADGKRKIAKAVKNKYEGTSGTASEITEYSTFDELSNKISQIPVEVPLGNAMEQNGGVLPFYDVYNEALKAMKEFAGYGFNGCCAFELDKWSYDSDHTISLSGAAAYYTSDKGELITTNTEYRFKDIDQPNTNRFVVFFYNIEEGDKYQVPTYLPATSVLNLWCIKGTPLISFNGNYTALNSINVYDGELEAKSSADLCIRNLTVLNVARLNHIKTINIKDKAPIYNNTNLKHLELNNLKNIISLSGTESLGEGSKNMFALSFPNLENAQGVVRILTHASGVTLLNVPKLKSINSSSNFIQSAKVRTLEFTALEEQLYDRIPIFYDQALNEVKFPKLHNTRGCIFNSSYIKKITLGNGMKDGIAGNIKMSMTTDTTLTTLTVAEGFKANLNLTGCYGLERDVLLGIINNLADLTDTEYADKLQLILGTTLYNKLKAEDILIATNKHWLVS